MNQFSKTEKTKRWAMGAVLSLVVIVLVYAGLTKDKDLPEKIFIASISAAGGFGFGYGMSKGK